MGFDNECILNIQSLAGEYFCPVCRLLVYPNEALQSQCTHLYCKPCLTYVVSTTRACPYDGYLVTEADSKPLIESNKVLAETIGKIAVHCLYHRSGCTWQGQLSECTTHCVSCPFGNSPVVCNRCGTQIVHRQVQEHAQNCPGVQPQAQQAYGGQDSMPTANSATTEQSQTTSQAATQASQAQPSQVSAALPSGQDQTQANTNSQPQAVAQAVPTAEQWYQQQQQQYQQYYQQYPGYDPSQQYYQQYDPYQQYQQQHLHTHPSYAIQGHQQPQQPQMYMQPQPQQQGQPSVQPQPQPQPQLHTQPHPQPQPQPQPQLQHQPQPQPQPQPQSQPQPQAQAHAHAPVAAQPQVQAQLNPQSVTQPHSQMQQQQPLPPSQGLQHPQLYPLGQPPVNMQPQQIPVQPHPQQRPHLPPHQQPQPQMQHPPPHQNPHSHPVPQAQLHPQGQLQQHTHVQMQPLQAQSIPQSYPQPQPQHSSAHPVTGHQSYPQSHPQQQIPQGASQQPLQHPGQVQPFPPQQRPQMRPPPMQQHQQPAMRPVHGQHPNMPPGQQLLHPHAHAPGQPAHQHPGLHPPYQQPVAPQVHGHAQQTQSFPAQASGLVHSQPHQSGPFLQQQPTMQPPLRPQAPPPSLQQHALAHPQLQQNAPPSHGLPPHQSQNLPGRPLMANHGLQHQQFQQTPSGPVGPHAKPMQSGAVLSYPPRTNAWPQSSSEQQIFVHQSGIPQSGTESAPFQSVTKTPVTSVHATVKTELKADAPTQNPEIKEENGLLATSSQGADSVELKIPRSESKLKSAGVDEKASNADESSEPISDVKEISEPLQVLEKDNSLLAKKDLEEPKIKEMVKEETSGILEPSAGGVAAETETKDRESVPFRSRQTENTQQEDKEIQEETLQKHVPLQKTEALEAMQKEAEMPHEGSDGSVPDKNSISVISQGQIPGSERNNMQAVPLKRDPSQLPPQEKMLPQPGYHERNMSQSQLPQQMNMQQCGPPHMQDRVHQRPHVPDQMLRPAMLPALQMQVPGHLPSQTRPPPHNMPGNIPVQGQPPLAPEHLRPPIAKQPHGSFHPDVPPGGFIGPGSSSLLGRGPTPLGPPHRGFESHSAAPQGHFNQGHPLPSHAAGPRIHGDQMVGPPLGGPAPGAFDSQGGLITRAPPHGSEGHIRHPVPANAREAEILGNQRPGYFDGRQPDSLLPGSAEHVPFGQPSNMPPNAMKMNGGPGKRLGSGFHDPSIPFGSQEERFKHLPDERFKRLPEEGFNMLPGDRFKPFPIEPGRHIIDRREFEEDLKQFPRSAQLDSEGVPKFESYFSRPDRASHGFNHDVGLKLDGSESAPRLLPPYQPGSLRLLDLRNDNMGRRVDTAGVPPDFLRSASESGRHRVDSFPPLSSPGREYSGHPSSRFGRLEDSDGRESRVFSERSKSFNLSSEGNAFHENRFPILPSHLRRGESDGSGSLPAHLRGGNLIGSNFPPGRLQSGEPIGHRNFPNHLHTGELPGIGGFHNRARVSDAGGLGSLPSNLRGESFGGNLPSRAHGAESGFSSGFPIHGYQNDGGFFNAGDMESFDLSRKRKFGSMGWCRICKVDCETAEGLDMHSQTREHQKMAMDVVLSIKKDSAKKQKLSSDDHKSHEDGSKSRKAGFESRGN